MPADSASPPEPVVQEADEPLTSTLETVSSSQDALAQPSLAEPGNVEQSGVSAEANLSPEPTEPAAETTIDSSETGEANVENTLPGDADSKGSSSETAGPASIPTEPTEVKSTSPRDLTESATPFPGHDNNVTASSGRAKPAKDMPELRIPSEDSHQYIETTPSQPVVSSLEPAETGHTSSMVVEQVHASAVSTDKASPFPPAAERSQARTESTEPATVSAQLPEPAIAPASAEPAEAARISTQPAQLADASSQAAKPDPKFAQPALHAKTSTDTKSANGATKSASGTTKSASGVTKSANGATKSASGATQPAPPAGNTEDESWKNLTVAEMRERLKARKRHDPRNDHLSFKRRHDIVQNM